MQTMTINKLVQEAIDCVPASRRGANNVEYLCEILGWVDLAIKENKWKHLYGIPFRMIASIAQSAIRKADKKRNRFAGLWRKSRRHCGK